MTYERWQDIKEHIKSHFTVTDDGKTDLEDSPGYLEFIEFSGPLGVVRLELVVRPRVKDVKTIYSKRMGSASTVEYEYDANEHTLTLHAYRQGAGGSWEELNANTLAASF